MSEHTHIDDLEIDLAQKETEIDALKARNAELTRALKKILELNRNTIVEIDNPYAFDAARAALATKKEPA